MGVSRRVLIRRKLLLPDCSGGEVEAGSRLKLKPNIPYFQMHKSTPHTHISRRVWPAGRGRFSFPSTLP